MRKMTRRGKVAVVVATVFMTTTFGLGHKYHEQKKDMDLIIEEFKQEKVYRKSLEDQIEASKAKSEDLNDELYKQIKINEALNEKNKELLDENDTLKKKIEHEQSRTINAVITAYTSGCKGCSGITKTGYDVRNTTKYKGMRVIATDPKVIPLYSIVEIETENGQKFTAISLDVGGAIKNNVVDYLVGSYNEAINFGRQKAVIRVIEWG